MHVGLRAEDTPSVFDLYIICVLFIAGFLAAVFGIRVFDRRAGRAERLCAGLAGGLDLDVKWGVLLLVLPWRPAAEICLAVAVLKMAGPLVCRRASRRSSWGGAVAFGLKVLGAPVVTCLGGATGIVACALTRSRDVRFRRGCLQFVPLWPVRWRGFTGCALGGCVLYGRPPADVIEQEHERYHTEQYVALGDALPIVWATVGVVCGVRTTPTGEHAMYIRASFDGRYGNPVERGAYRYQGRLSRLRRPERWLGDVSEHVRGGPLFG